MQLNQFYNDSLYSKTLVYWYEEWDAYSKKVEDGSIGIDIVNIRVVLLDLINEYELNKFESENNRKVYLKLIENTIIEKHMKLYRDELLVLKEKLEKKDAQSVYIIAKELSKKLSKENFAQILYDELFLIISKKVFSKKDRIKIKNLTKDIIVELVTSGRGIEDIKKLLSDVFKTYQMLGEEPLILFDFTPSDLSPTQAKDYIDNLNLKDRLDIFRENLLPKNSEYIFIFPVWGMICPPEDENDTIFDFSLYDPVQEKKYPEDTWFDETFNVNGQGNAKYESRCNAFIKVHAISNNVAKRIAEEKFINFLNLANLMFSNKYAEFFWDRQYIGKKISSGYGSFGTAFTPTRDDRFFRRSLSKDNPVYFSNKKYQQLTDYSKVIDVLKQKNMFIELNSIVNVISLLSKSIWETEENKLLNYWICLESLSDISKKNNESKFDFIKETVSNIYFLWERFKPVHNLFSMTTYYSVNKSYYGNSTNLPDDYLEDVGVIKAQSIDTQVSLKKFYLRMPELLSYTTKESFLDSIEDTIDFYKDNKKALQMMRNKKAEVKLTIDYIYKSRNQIVHNGFVAKNLIPYLVNSAESYAKSLFHTIIDVYLKGEFNLQNHFIKEQYEGILLEKKLSSGEFHEIGLGE